MRPRIEKDYRILRQLSPWQFGLSLSFAPSSNLNNETLQHSGAQPRHYCSLVGSN